MRSPMMGRLSSLFEDLRKAWNQVCKASKKRMEEEEQMAMVLDLGRNEDGVELWFSPAEVDPLLKRSAVSLLKLFSLHTGCNWNHQLWQKKTVMELQSYQVANSNDTLHVYTIGRHWNLTLMASSFWFGFPSLISRSGEAPARGNLVDQSSPIGHKLHIPCWGGFRIDSTINTNQERSILINVMTYLAVTFVTLL